MYAGDSSSGIKVAEYGGNTHGFGSRSVLGKGWPKDLVKVGQLCVMLHCTVLYCIVLYCIVLYYIVLYLGESLRTALKKFYHLNDEAKE